MAVLPSQSHLRLSLNVSMARIVVVPCVQMLVASIPCVSQWPGSSSCHADKCFSFVVFHEITETTQVRVITSLSLDDTGLQSTTALSQPICLDARQLWSFQHIWSQLLPMLIHHIAMHINAENKKQSQMTYVTG